MIEPAIYTGTLRHRRFEPAAHSFDYGVCLALLDIDRIPELMSASRLLACNRWNWAAFHDRDHLGDPALPLRRRLEIDAASQGVALPSGRVFLLTHLRYLGYCFNPVSFYFCCGETGAPEAVLAEVNNTFGERRMYWLGPHNAEASGPAMRYCSPKTMHVSPFLKMDHDYRFVFTPPEERLTIHMDVLSGANRVFDATLSLQRRPWTAAAIRRALVAYPWMTMKVIAAIHWQALRLWAKSVPFYSHPDSSVKWKIW